MDTETKKVEIKRTITFNVKTNSYTLNFPTVRNFIEIENKRMALSNGTYSQLLKSILKSSGMAMDMIDMVATLTILAPELMLDMKVDILNMDMIDAVELLTAYNKEVKSWIDDNTSTIYNAYQKNG